LLIWCCGAPGRVWVDDCQTLFNFVMVWGNCQIVLDNIEIVSSYFTVFKQVVLLLCTTFLWYSVSSFVCMTVLLHCKHTSVYIHLPSAMHVDLASSLQNDKIWSKKFPCLWPSFSYVCVKSHNWSANQELHCQRSVVEISHHLTSSRVDVVGRHFDLTSETQIINPMELTAAVSLWCISILCALEDRAILRSLWNTNTAPPWHFRLWELLHEHRFTCWYKLCFVITMTFVIDVISALLCRIDIQLSTGCSVVMLHALSLLSPLPTLATHADNCTWRLQITCTR